MGDRKKNENEWFNRQQSQAIARNSFGAIVGWMLADLKEDQKDSEGDGLALPIPQIIYYTPGFAQQETVIGPMKEPPSVSVFGCLDFKTNGDVEWTTFKDFSRDREGNPITKDRNPHFVDIPVGERNMRVQRLATSTFHPQNKDDLLKYSKVRQCAASQPRLFVDAVCSQTGKAWRMMAIKLAEKDRKVYYKRDSTSIMKVNVQ